MEEHKKFYQMDLWKEAFQLQKEIYEIIKNFPKSEEYGLVSQLNRSTNSICANLAESHGRYYFLDKIRVLYIVRGEIEETQSHLIVAMSRGLVERKAGVKLVERYEKVKMSANNYINSLYKQKKQK